MEKNSKSKKKPENISNWWLVFAKKSSYNTTIAANQLHLPDRRKCEAQMKCEEPPKLPNIVLLQFWNHLEFIFIGVMYGYKVMHMCTTSNNIKEYFCW